jgi:hypothetical protein
MVIEYFNMAQRKEIEFDYVNWRGESSKRKAILHSIIFGANEWHQEPQFLFAATDMEKNELRYFAVKDMTNIKVTPREIVSCFLLDNETLSNNQN